MNILNVTFLVSMNICPTGFKPNKFEFIFLGGGGGLGWGWGWGVDHALVQNKSTMMIEIQK